MLALTLPTCPFAPGGAGSEIGRLTAVGRGIADVQSLSLA
jgi:hypothetical protein